MKRFYKDVTIAEAGDGGWQVQLDGRGIRSQGGGQQIVPTKALARMLAGEWQDQGEDIDPRRFVFRDMADFAIDVVRADRADAIGNLIKFSQTDTLCYRGDPTDALFKRQEEMWEPLVTACEKRHAIAFSRVSGIMHDPQPSETVDRLRTILAGLDDFTLAGLQTLTALAASLIVGLEALEEGADADALFAIANVEEDWQAELWGWDGEAEQRRAMRLDAFRLALEFVQAARA